MLEKYSNFVIPNSNQMERIVNDYPTFLKEEAQNQETTPVENDGKNIKLFYTIETKRIEIPVGSETGIRQDDKKETFDKIIKRITKISKFIKLPAPILTKIETKKYYTLVSFGEHSMSYYYDNFSNGKNYTEDIDEVERVKNEIMTKPHGKSKWRVTSKDVNVYDLTMATVIKPEDEWIILGTFDYVDNLLKAAPGQQIPIEMVNMDKSECDHCHKNIYRKKTVFIKKIKDGSIIKVGGTCIKNYLGYDYEKVLSYLTDISFLDKSWGESGGWNNDYDYEGGGRGGWIEDEVPIKEAIRYYIWWYKNRGYMSKTTAEKINIKKREEWKSQNPDDSSDFTGKETISTGDSVCGDVGYANTPPRQTGKYAAEEWNRWEDFCSNVYGPRLETISENDPHIKAFIEFIEANKDNNFLFNVSNMIKQGTVKVHLLRYITGGCSFYFGRLFSEEQKRKAETREDKPQQKTSEWVGKIGEKSKFVNLEIVHIGGFETQFGWSNVYRLKDEDGNIYTKFGVIGPQFVVKKKNNDVPTEEPDKQEIEDMKNYSDGLVVGDVVSATADVKDHTEYKGTKQTVLGRFSKLK